MQCRGRACGLRAVGLIVGGLWQEGRLPGLWSVRLCRGGHGLPHACRDKKAALSLDACLPPNPTLFLEPSGWLGTAVECGARLQRRAGQAGLQPAYHSEWGLSELVSVHPHLSSSTSGYRPKRTEHRCSHNNLAALFTTAKRWKQPRCWSTCEWIGKITQPSQERAPTGCMQRNLGSSALSDRGQCRRLRSACRMSQQANPQRRIERSVAARWWGRRRQ